MRCLFTTKSAAQRTVALYSVCMCLCGVCICVCACAYAQCTYVCAGMYGHTYVLNQEYIRYIISTLNCIRGFRQNLSRSVCKLFLLAFLAHWHSLLFLTRGLLVSFAQKPLVLRIPVSSEAPVSLTLPLDRTAVCVPLGSLGPTVRQPSTSLCRCSQVCVHTIYVW